MKRPPKKYVCEKCGYLGDTSEHEGCDYLAWTTGEQLCIDQLERELALLKASPASAPEGYAIVPVEPTMEMCEAGWNEYDLQEHFSVRFMYERMIAAAPTPPSTEDRECDAMICSDIPRAWEVWVRYIDRESEWKWYRTTEVAKFALETVKRIEGPPIVCKIVPLYALEETDETL